MDASGKQIGYIIGLANQLTGRGDTHLASVLDVLPASISKTAANRGLTSEQASACIDHLQRAIKTAEPAQASAPRSPRKRKTITTTDGAPSPQDVLDVILSGRIVEITSAKTGRTYRTSIEGLTRTSDGLRVITVDHRPGSIALDNIASWTVLT